MRQRNSDWVRAIFLILLIAGIVFQSTTIFLPESIHRDEGMDQRYFRDPGFRIPPFFQKEVLSHGPLLKGAFRLSATYHLWPVAITYSIFKPSRIIYRFFMFAFIMLFVFSFYRLMLIWFNREVAYVATIYAVFSSAIADFAVLWHIASITVTYFAIYFLETKRSRRPFLACFLLALSAYEYSPARLVVLGYVITFCLLRWDECKKNPYPYLLFLLLVLPLIVITYFCPQEVPDTFFVSFKDFFEKAKYAFWYRQETGVIHSALGKRVVSPILSIGAAIYVFVALKKIMRTKNIDWKKYYGHVYFSISIALLFIFIYLTPYVQSRLVVWALPAFYAFTALLIYQISRKIYRWKYYTFILAPCLLFYIAAEVPPHIKKITHPTINGFYCYGADKILPYLLKENPEKLFVDSYMSDVLLIYSAGKLNIDKLKYYQLNSTTFPWDIGSTFQGEAYFVFWKDSPQPKKFFEIAQKERWAYTLKKEFDFPRHRSAILIYKVKQVADV